MNIYQHHQHHDDDKLGCVGDEVRAELTCASLHSGTELLQSHTTGNEMMMMVAMLMIMMVVVMLIITMMIKLNDQTTIHPLIYVRRRVKILPTFFTEDSRRNHPKAIHIISLSSFLNTYCSMDESNCSTFW